MMTFSPPLRTTADMAVPMEGLRSDDDALPVHSDVHACKFALAFQIADDILG